ncbi:MULTISPECIES: GNAT family N-acetyltransferase [Actibacterium]|jgi:RimJ/RimL family protein N-acetyltransferase|uniref:RimJ/RimL family protein N-acetyltransferase n=1 Tax=Actibacterium naphthalenivorans TaxID=1614693 RepID=A0A840CBV2_9RHOB|nr:MULTISPECIES: GNAT family N-acetyltransferase [Actibacterium]ALG90393.1 acetyltransferase [Actibacterium sp. EMB200-NS6]MBB4022323.1 RimJ/RimL family protein N-acetyltransferase [Actibacterium naphthalenivorans]
MKMDSIVSQPVIETERFQLRPVRKSDAGLLQMYAGDLRVARFTRSIPHPLPPGAIEAYIARAQSETRTEDVWVMDGSDQSLSEVLGVVSLERMERAQSQIGYWVAPAFWNTGIASEAVNALLAADPQKSQTVFAEVFQDNPGSARVLTNAGFNYIGDAEAYSVARGGKVATWTYLKKLN